MDYLVWIILFWSGYALKVELKYCFGSHHGVWRSALGNLHWKIFWVDLLSFIVYPHVYFGINFGRCVRVWVHLNQLRRMCGVDFGSPLSPRVDRIVYNWFRWPSLCNLIYYILGWRSWEFKWICLYLRMSKCMCYGVQKSGMCLKWFDVDVNDMQTNLMKKVCES